MLNSSIDVQHILAVNRSKGFTKSQSNKMHDNEKYSVDIIGIPKQEFSQRGRMAFVKKSSKNA